MSDIIDLLQKDPTAILQNPENSKQILALVKTLFDPIAKGNSVLDEIHVQGLDASQVWPQSKMILDSVVDKLMFETIPSLKRHDSDDEGEESLEEELSGSDEEGESHIQNAEDDSEDEHDEDEDFEDSEEGEGIQDGEYSEGSEDEFAQDGKLIDDYEETDGEGADPSEDDTKPQEQEEQKVHEPRDEPSDVKKDAFGLNDEFFSIDEFNKQSLLADDDDYEDEDEEKIDFFADIPSSDDEEAVYFDDFFDKPQKNSYNDRRSSKPRKDKKKQESEDEEEEEKDLNEDDYDDGMKTAMLDLFDEAEEQKSNSKSKDNLSSFEKQQLEIQKQISALEREAIAEKKWTMKGEVKAKDRQPDALLQEDLEFERTAKPVPVITKEVTESLEEMIRRRIKEENFDDLPRRVIGDVSNFRPSSTFELSETKSSKSLAELYEDDFKGQETKDAISEELQKAHDEIKDLFQSISHKLDSLSSAHFIPKPAQKSIDIKVNAPTISMEDAQPLTLSNASTLAPQEIYKASRSGDANEISLKSGAVVARDELSREDKQRLRRANKRKRSRDFQAKEVAGTNKKSKKQDVIDTLSKAGNVTIINNKGEKRDVRGALKVDKAKQGTSSLKL